jgi:predicted lysophospholipase L1 biosynthesis ABC-type transport system permease subunit
MNELNEDDIPKTILLSGLGGFLGALIAMVLTAALNIFVAMLLVFSLFPFLIGIVCGVVTSLLINLVEYKKEKEFSSLKRIGIGLAIATIPSAIWFYLQFRATLANNFIIPTIAIFYLFFVGTMPVIIGFRKRT